ncbi:MAG TPA: hypothetical protein VD833_25345 [Vicinamibacterales bacterium]|nr:hypothetical protein [Vicinamibacterales bacterium]
MTSRPPIPDTYWLLEGRLLAGSYAGSWTREKASRKLARFLEAGIRTFIDLTETSEPLEPYEALLAELACEKGLECRYRRFAIRDRDVPTRELMVDILNAIGAEIEEERTVYVHCWGGIGRTGTVAACWLIEQGLSAKEALVRVQTLRWGEPSEWQLSPETHEQREFVAAWRRLADEA